MTESYQRTVSESNEPYDDVPVVVEGRFRFRRRLLQPLVGVTVGCVLLMATFTATRSGRIVSIMASPSMRTAKIADHPDLPKHVEEDVKELEKWYRKNPFEKCCFWCPNGESSARTKVSCPFLGAFQAAAS